MGQVIPFRRKPMAVVNPVMLPAAQYFIGLAFLGIIAMAWLEQFAGGQRHVG